MTHHFMGISGGKICLYFADDRDTCCEFDSEREAAEALVDRMMHTGITQIMLSSSVDFPEEDGLPGFRYDEFHSKVQQVLDRLHEQASHN